MADRHERGLLDTSVIIDLESLEADMLPVDAAISALTLAELAAGPHAARTAAERAIRQDRLQRTEAQFDPLPFDVNAARAYGRIYASVVASGRTARRPRSVDLMVAAVAVANDLPLYTRNPKDLEGLGELVEVVKV